MIYAAKVRENRMSLKNTSALMEPSFILGLSFSHNATACVVDGRNGAVVFCCSEERFSRRKNEWGIPLRTLDYIFSHVLRPEQVTTVAVGESCRLRYGCQEYARLINLADYATKDEYIRSKMKLWRVLVKEALARPFRPAVELQGLVTEKLRDLGVSAQVVFADHHTAHAASGYYCSPFDEALVITLDGEGDGLSGSCWHGKGAKLTRVHVLPDYASVGLFYKSITSLLGFKVNQEEGKVMGLAGYGDPARFYPLLRTFLNATVQNGELTVFSKAACRHMDKLSRRKVYFFRLLSCLPMVLRAKDWKGLLNCVLRKEFRDLYREILDDHAKEIPFSVAADIAAAAQRVLEDTVLEVVRFYQSEVPSRKIVLAGGVFANVRLNQRILELPGAEEIYVHPGMGDEGLALGAALLHLHAARREKSANAVLRHVFHGPLYDDDAIQTALSACPVSWEHLTDEQIIERVARALAADRIVGLVRGALEYGPRALGRRSILANPMGKDIRARLNKRLGRTEFMPFAPTVLDECFDTFFVGLKPHRARLPARFMTITLDVQPAWRDRIPAVVHVDGTARPQLLCRQDDPFFYSIVQRFYQLTGLGCVLNTSFNMHEEPIINTPDDAVRASSQGAVDLLVLGNCVVDDFTP